MKIDSLTLKVQDLPSKDGEMFAAISGKLILNTGEVKKNEDGTDYRDEQGDLVPILEDINFMTALNAYPDLKTCIKELCTEALTLKNLEVNGDAGDDLMSHFVRAKRGTRSIPTKKRKKV